jgi:hypothetical protein
LEIQAEAMATKGTGGAKAAGNAVPLGAIRIRLLFSSVSSVKSVVKI